MSLSVSKADTGDPSEIPHLQRSCPCKALHAAQSLQAARLMQASLILLFFFPFYNSFETFRWLHQPFEMPVQQPGWVVSAVLLHNRCTSVEPRTAQQMLTAQG